MRRLFSLMTRRGFVGVTWLAAAVVCVVAAEPWTWWHVGPDTEVFANPELGQGLAIALVIGLLGWTGLIWRRERGQGTPDRVLESPPDKGRFGHWPGRIGVALLIVGALFVVGDWLAAHRLAPAGELVLPLNETQETVEVTQGARSVELMLPLRTTLRGVEFGEKPVAEVQFTRPAQDAVVPREFVPGQSLDIEGKRFVFSGLSRDRTQLRAIISSDEAQTIETAGVVGDTIQVSIDGPSYEITDVTRDYLEVYAPSPDMDRMTTQLMLLSQSYPLGVMGPAVQLENERGQSFWVFERGDNPDIPQRLTLESVQEIPAVVMTVSSVRPFWPFALGLALMILGWVLLFGFRECVIRRRRDGSIVAWSFNGAETLGQRDGSGRWKTLFSAAVQLTAILAVGGAYLVGSAPSVVVVLAALAALIALSGGGESVARRRATAVATAIPVAIILGALFAGIRPQIGDPPGLEAVLWTAHLGCWIAMAVGVFVAGVRAEASLPGTPTKGAVTAALGVWAAMGVVVTMALQRGRELGDTMGLPLISDDGAAQWSIPDVMAVSTLEIPVVAPAQELAFAATACALLGSIGLIGMVIRRQRVALFGWIGALVSAVTGILQLFGFGTSIPGVEELDDTAYQEAATTWLEARNLPPWLADMGRFETEGALALDTASLGPEMAAFGGAALLALAMISMAVIGDGEFRHGEHAGDRQSLAGRDTLVRATIYGWLGWGLGLLLSWERLGVVGLQSSMEWLGLAALLCAMGILTIGWRGGTEASPPERFFRAFGPAFILCVLIALGALGLSGGIMPGSSIAIG